MTEAWGGGVSTAVLSYARSTPEFRHIMLATHRESESTGDYDDHAYTIIDLPKNKIAALLRIGRAYRQLQPALVHVHSSYAGFLARISIRVPRKKIAYTPHCYAFERTDVSPTLRRLFCLIEKFLMLRTAVTIASSPREAQLARAMSTGISSGSRVVYVPNAVFVEPAERPKARSPLRVVTIGRLAPQKDPGFFRDVVDVAQRTDKEIEWQWIGGGPAHLVDSLREMGITVSDWLPREEVIALLREADVYMHTAAWESGPMAILEAAAIGLPVVGRRIPALQGTGISRLGTSPSDVADLILGLREPAEYDAAVIESSQLAGAHSIERQAEALGPIYRDLAHARVVCSNE